MPQLTQSDKSYAEYMLKMGRMWEDKEQVWQAIKAYRDIVTSYPDFPEAQEALTRLQGIAQRWDRDEKHHEAMGLWDMMRKIS